MSQGFDPADYSTEPPASYRANRPLPGWDLHPQGDRAFRGAPEFRGVEVYWRFDRSALCQALFDFAVKLRAHSAQLRVKLIALPQTAPTAPANRLGRAQRLASRRGSERNNHGHDPRHGLLMAWMDVDPPFDPPIAYSTAGTLRVRSTARWLHRFPPPPAAPPRNTSRWSPFLQLAVSRRPISATTWNTGCFGLEAVHGCPASDRWWPAMRLPCRLLRQEPRQSCGSDSGRSRRDSASISDLPPLVVALIAIILSCRLFSSA